jgi:glycosyltransferase involved in cell wall biosynthesis
MTTSSPIVHGWVEPTWASAHPELWAELKALGQAFTQHGARFVPLKLASGLASFAALSPTELGEFWGAPDLEPVHPSPEAIGFVLHFWQAAGPPFPASVLKLAGAGGGRVAVLTPDADTMTLPASARNVATSILRSPMSSDRDGWLGCARQLLTTFSAPSEPVRRAVTGRDRPLLSICISTYNRAAWLRHSLALTLRHTALYKDLVEVIVCDNASEDDTQAAAESFLHHQNFAYHRNPKNIGMLGNLGASCDKARGRYVWVIGDDDLLVEGTVERVLAAIVRHPRSEVIYTNYAFTRFDRPEDLNDTEQVIRGARAISPEVRDEFAERVSAIATKSNNCFTAIYCIIYREDHARAAYHQDVSGKPFRSLLTTVPTADYVCRHLFDRPGYWIGDPCVVVNLNVSWMRYASLFILERFPELFDLMEEKGVPRNRMDVLRADHVRHVPRWFREIYLGTHREHLDGFSAERLVRRFGHLPEFRRRWPRLLRVYEKAYAGAGVEDPNLSPDRLSALLSSQTSGPS